MRTKRATRWGGRWRATAAGLAAAALAASLGTGVSGWWPSSLQVSPDGTRLYVANARGRGAGPNNNFPPDNLGSPKYSVLGTVSLITVPTTQRELDTLTERVYANNGFVEQAIADEDNPIPTEPGVASEQIEHVIFLNKENATHDLMLGDITITRQDVAVEAEPAYSLGYDASPNHHELALRYAFSDNFFREPSVSSDGHRWLTDTYTTEFEETHWPASYGGKRNDSGDDPEVIANYPGRIGFTDANSSPEPHDYNQHGGVGSLVTKRLRGSPGSACLVTKLLLRNPRVEAPASRNPQEPAARPKATSAVGRCDARQAHLERLPAQVAEARARREAE